MRTGILLASLLVLLPLAASGEIYRCPGPEGKVVFQSAPCGDRQPYQPKGNVLRARPGAPAPAPRSTSAPRPAAQAPSGGKTTDEPFWRGKFKQARADAKKLEQQAEQARKQFHRCRSRHSANSRCKSEKLKMLEAEKRATKARHYVENGIGEECRRAGCQPGWVR
jgi:hypothetical protein